MMIEALDHKSDRETPRDQIVDDDVTPSLVEHPRHRNEDRLRELTAILAILDRKSSVKSPSSRKSPANSQ
jgi:hypothetical protein